MLAPASVPTLTTSEVRVNDHHRVRLEVVTLDRAQAKTWLMRYAYPRQRPEYINVVRNYRDMMQRGEWQPSTIILATYDGTPQHSHEALGDGPLLAGGTYLLNGRHRLAAVIDSDTVQPFLVEHHVVSWPADVHHLYMVQDRGRSRSAGDVYHALGLDEKLGLSLHNLRMIGEGHHYISSGFSQRRPAVIDAYARAAFVQEWADEGRDWLTCVAGARAKTMVLFTASPVTAVALVILRWQRERGMAFLTAFTHDDGLHQGTPEKTLHDWVLVTRVRTMLDHHYARHVAAAWNAYYEGRGLERVLIRDPDIPIKIAGTPFTGRQAPGPLPAALLARPGAANVQ
jgi:hypothetical protein